ncbi:multifunctional CCA addition/repair protein [Candidatus Blochmannia ocreatus (nom. nud.)]|uniref:CCA-adding enzyme n=1 Tax=Candidatus Blochmannia ocreatus (nom. nud.) TaxID=251538 RepID=A0ABY4STE1_9ENTR|nr:multifunctional CCA addition/repair protein [Candidatus Blochmannia ocreatus]URJ25151.1 multifunctional CCA addition/repair protein [Candidatus Blochmannia ocreatus]
MKKYLVGGAVRDMLLKLPIKEKDWVIVGSNPQEMLNTGYSQVGKDFPVFLHPKTHEEYALARTERKSGLGYTGFICNTTSSITIEEDLYRRDLTINAMAYDPNTNVIIDPYHGQQDIQLRLLRHVSHTFNEDPLRVLRVARFAAKLAYMHFTIAPDTLALMKTMSKELITIPSERIWTETKKALITNSPQIYFKILYYCGALKILFPEINMLFNKFSIAENHTEMNIGAYTMQALSKIAFLTNDINIRFSILCRDLDTKFFFNKTQNNINTNYINKKQSGISNIRNLCNRLKIPNKIRNFAETVSKYRNYLYNFKQLPSEILIILFNNFDCWHYPNKIEKIILINKSNITKYKKFQNDALSDQEKFLRSAFSIAQKISTVNIINDGFTGVNISKELYLRRLHALNTWRHKK